MVAYSDRGEGRSELVAKSQLLSAKLLLQCCFGRISRGTEFHNFPDLDSETALVQVPAHVRTGSCAAISSPAPSKD